MSSLKHVRAAPFVAAIFFALGSAVAQSNFLITKPEPQWSAWWLRTEFYPFDKEVRGIPVRKIRSTWCKATEFRRELFPENFQPDIANSGLSFAVDGIFDGSKANQTALVGVYETCNHERGSFLLVLAMQRMGHLQFVSFTKCQAIVSSPSSRSPRTPPLSWCFTVWSAIIS